MKIAEDLLRKVSEEKQYRAMGVDPGAIDEEARTVRLAFSSEDEYERWFGIEILDHSPSAVRLDRYMREGAAFLVNHDTADLVGVVEDVEISTDRRGRAVVRFGESARADEIFRDIVNGIRRFVSVGYMVHKMVMEETSDSGPDRYRVTDWEPFEISTVPVPADPTVGIGKSLEDTVPAVPEVTKEVEMKPEDNKTPEAPEVDVKAITADARQSGEQAERARISEIMALSKDHGHGDAAASFVKDGKTADAFRTHILETRGDMTPVDSSPDVGLSNKETKRYSITRAINAVANPSNKRAQDAAGFEMECAVAAGEKISGTRNGNLAIPNEILTRDMLVGTDSAGGYLVGTDHLGGSFIDVLRNKAMVMQMGATELTGLVGDVAIPKQTAAATAYWVAENGAPTESAITLGQLAMSPKTIAAYTDLSRKLIMQSSPAADGLVFDDLGTILGIGIDLAALHGSGASNEPTGIAPIVSDAITFPTGVGQVVGGTDGLAPAWSHAVDMETNVGAANADAANMGYLTNAKVRGKLRQTFANTTGGDTPIWMGGTEGFGMVNGYRAGVSNNVTSTVDKGTSTAVCSAIFFGDWAQLIVALWGGLDLLVDPYTGSTAGTVRITAFQSADIGVRQYAAFSVMGDALT